MTARARPCRCPSCGEDLIVTCPNRCENAELGATAAPDPVALLYKPPGRRWNHPHHGKRGTLSHRRYREKPCARCKQSFTPSGPRALYCDDCGRRRAA